MSSKQLRTARPHFASREAVAPALCDWHTAGLMRELDARSLHFHLQARLFIGPPPTRRAASFRSPSCHLVNLAVLSLFAACTVVRSCIGRAMRTLYLWSSALWAALSGAQYVKRRESSQTGPIS